MPNHLIKNYLINDEWSLTEDGYIKHTKCNIIPVLIHNKLKCRHCNIFAPEEINFFGITTKSYLPENINRFTSSLNKVLNSVYNKEFMDRLLNLKGYLG